MDVKNGLLSLVEEHKQVKNIFVIELENEFVNVLEVAFANDVVVDEMFDNFELFDSFDFLME